MENQPKISTVESFLLLSAAGLVDAAGIGLLVFGLDDFFILDMFSTTTQFYFRMKGVSKAGYDLAATIGEWIPYVGALPLKTAGVAAVIWADRHPESTITKVAQKAAVKKAPMAASQVPGIKTPIGGLKKAA